MPMIAFRSSAERLMLDMMDVGASKASANVHVVRKRYIPTSAARIASNMDVTHLLPRSKRQCLEPGRRQCQATNGRTTSSTPTTGRASWSRETSALLEWLQETKSGRPDLWSYPWPGYEAQRPDIVFQVQILLQESVFPRKGKKTRRQYSNVGTTYEAP